MPSPPTAPLTPRPLLVEVRDRVGVAVARRRARRMARRIGFAKIEVEKIVLSVSELGNNLWQHGGGGTLTLEPLASPVGLRVVAEDGGPGIADLAEALRDGSGTGLGSGLAAVGRLMDEMVVSSVVAQGSRIEAIKWLC